MSRLAPAGPVYQAGTLSGNPLACAAGLATLRLADDARLPAARRDRRDRRQAGRRRAGRRRACRTGCRTPATCSRSSSPTPTWSTTTPPGPRTWPRSRRSSTRCWPAASTCRRARSSRGSCRRRSTTPRWSSIAAALPAAAARGGGRSAGGRRVSRRRSSTCCGTARCTTRTRSCTAGCPASSSPSWACRWPRRPRSRSPTGTSRTWWPARWSGRRRRPSRSPPSSACRSRSTSG